MNPKKKRKIKNRIRDYTINTVLSLVFAGGMYFVGFLGVVPQVATLVSPKIKTQSQLETLVNKKMREMNFPKDIEMITRLKGDTIAGKGGELEENQYLIQLGGIFKTKNGLDHELYHVYDKHFEGLAKLDSKFKKWIAYHFWYEPQAIIYSIFKLKL